MFGRLDADGGQLNSFKCKVVRTRIKLLVHKVSSNGISPDLRKVEALLLQDPPTHMQALLSFIYKLRYLFRFFGTLAEYIHPLQKAIQANPFRWTKVEDAAFENIKEKLSRLHVLMSLVWINLFMLV